MNKAVLIVDDSEINREVYAAQFEDDYDVLQAASGEEAMRVIEEHRKDIAVILLDLVMPRKGGFEVLDFMRFNNYKDRIPVILLTGDENQSMEMKALQKGADDFLTKEADANVVRRRVANMIQLYEYKRQLEEMIDEKEERLHSMSQFVIDALLAVMEAQDPESRASLLRIRSYTREILEFLSSYWDEFYALQPDEIKVIEDVSVLHDIGEVAVPESIFAKQPLLSVEEQKIYESHTMHGRDIVQSMESIENTQYAKAACEICESHHERWDGSGFPQHLTGDQIPVSAQVVGLADTYEGLRSGALTGRSYSHEEALSAIERGEFGGFSPVLTETCKVIGDRMAQIYEGDAAKDDAYRDSAWA